MTRKEAIEVLQASSIKQMSLTKIIVNGKDLSVKTALEMAIEALKQEPKWIPVSERLPEEDDLYLITFDNGEIDLVAFDRGDFSYSGVIAWMPLPQPYKAESLELATKKK